VNISEEEAKSLSEEGFRFSGHTHPGTSSMVLYASKGDTRILACFNQKESAIYNSKGQYRRFN
jgi:hypothetical protein